jgi:predicted O-methyltransferase YrrM
MAEEGHAPKPPTGLGRVLQRLDPALDALFRLKGVVWGLAPGRRRRDAEAFAALCRDARFAALRDYEEFARPIRAALLPHYEHYVSRVSLGWMAVSLELAVFLAALCRVLRPGRLVDLGSGFSSFVFRRYQAEAEPPPEVWSVDDSAGWLERTGRFLEGQGLPSANLATWQDFVGQGPGRFDLVLHDLGSLRVRRATLPQALDLVAPGGVAVLDDVHYGSIRRHALRVLRERGLTPHGLGAPTRDCYGRYALLVAT